eukprot:Protomagalhaensia_sp_Gyna_25__796@NODE_1383_length_1893_cov_13_142395_g1112_i0_p1_GENE_NODE_1383_length_1893_cov_13_142395_g1112_i0NODE_1383_length_1893_cov_13_142395_g1112_i0_p1_ORF_typecomplete_len466_score85_23DUF5600/PF18150_1/9_7e30Dynamin_N/PF00350_23/2_1e14EHD_N/PF16880_5/1_2e10MMR_HSR1/PF01926_23/2_9e07FeoB_N/PF02421_18/7_8FeoB_N/PF02421_18/0_00053GTP_EFTU/PF00009_27/16GTP_EFTU/PF00009_27/0_00065RsgA_GTPase/PF03193_16/7_4RsgA_GTPase/PF03193_16/0_22Septin/PF00735_18/0_014Septin/PF00735_18
MWHKMNKAGPPVVESFTSITEGLADMYRTHLLPLERDYKFGHFYSPMMTDGDFKAKPMVLLLGQYSTGKTTFVRHLLEKDYPGLRIGPEPTTDKFVAVCHSDRLNVSPQDVGDEAIPPQVLPGHAAVVDRSLPWSQLENFGPGFLSRFEVVHVNSPVFQGVTLIDTPGVLAGNKQWERGYDFEGVIKWFAERVDLVLLFFDAHKLDISDEFRRCIQALKGNDSKVCILLNKADSVSAQQLMRVYGALMWSLGKVLPVPEVPRIHIGSFWDQPLQNEESRKLFEAESDDLFKTVFALPARSAARKIDDFLKRVRLCRVHALLMDYLRKQMPLIGKAAKQKELLNNLKDIYELLAKHHSLPISDFPPEEEMKGKLSIVGEFQKFPKLELRRIRALDTMLQTKIAALTRLIPKEEVMVLSLTTYYTNPFSNGRPTEWVHRMTSSTQAPTLMQDDEVLPSDEAPEVLIM